ncbi:MAG: efflux RND transporter periplasmic adaptor subunit [Patescibacteria group bacterium]|nr:efflux RND transporter periplasmic adaptor subunit [Patescibacteria group bacterium]
MSKKKKIILVVTAVIVLFIIGGIVFKPKAKITYQTEKVKRGDLVQTVEATGEVKSATDIALNFRTSGRVAKISVKEGQVVKTGAVLANLENNKENSQVLSAQSQLLSARAELEKLLAGASRADISVSEATVAQRQQDLTTARNVLEDTKKIRDTEINNLKETALATMNNELATALGSLSTVKNTLDDNDLSYTLGALNVNSVEDARNAKIAADSSWNEIDLLLNTLSSVSTTEQILTGLDQEILMLDKVADAVNKTLTVLQNSLTSNYVTQTELDAFKANIKAEQVKINASRTAVVTAKNNINSKISYYLDLIRQKENAVSAAELAYGAAEAALTLKREPARPFEIKIAESKVKQAEASLLSASAQLEDTIIRAPIDGIVTQIMPKAGELVSLSTPVMQILGASEFEVDVDVPESDIVKLAIGQKAEVTFDALGLEKKFGATISSIEMAETKIQDVIYYKVRIQPETEQLEIKSGMTANVTIFTAQKNGVLIVPSRAIKTNTEKYVEILKDDNAVERRTVVVGLRGDDGVEVVSGVNEGEDVITFTKK